MLHTTIFALAAAAQTTKDVSQTPTWVTILVGFLGFLGTVGGAWLAKRATERQANASIAAAQAAAKAAVEAAKATSHASLEEEREKRFAVYQDAKRNANLAFIGAAATLCEEPQVRAHQIAYLETYSLVNSLVYRETREYLDQFSVPPSKRSTKQGWEQVAKALRRKWDELENALETDRGWTGPVR